MVLAGVAGLVAILLAMVLATPFDLELSAAKDADEPAVRVKATLSWLGLPLSGRSTDRQPSKTRPRTGTRQASIGWSTLKAAMTSPGFMRRLVRLAADLVRLTRPRSVYLRARLGFDDPSDTGMLLAWAYGLQSAPWARVIHIEPDFADEVAEGEMRVRWSRSLGALLWPFLTFCASPAVWRAGRVLVTRT